MNHCKILAISLTLLLISSCKGISNNKEEQKMNVITNPINQNIELGKVTWLRNYSEALEESKIQNKPVLLFFQEIPGCSTCVNYGRDVLSHPLMVEFIENEFIPLAIYNNKKGADSEILNLYNEPSWNNPVTHFVDHKGNDIITKLANNYHPLSMFNKMIEVLSVVKKPIPLYAQLLGEDLKMEYGYLASTVYETPCFWSGETSLALNPAVRYTEAGWIGSKEVVKVFFDKDVTALSDLDIYAKREGFYTIKTHESFKTDKDPQYYVSKSPFKYLPLSKAQRAKINVSIPYNGQPEQYLSPKQLSLYNEVLNNASTLTIDTNYKRDIELSWNWK